MWRWLQSYPYENITDIILYTIEPATPLPPTAVVPFQYPIFKQCDPLWGNDTMVRITGLCACLLLPVPSVRRSRCR